MMLPLHLPIRLLGSCILTNKQEKNTGWKVEAQLGVGEHGTVTGLTERQEVDRLARPVEKLELTPNHMHHNALGQGPGS